MRSVRIAGTGGPEVVRVVEVPKPRAPRRDELLVRVHASSINGTDLGIRRGALPLITRLRPAFPLGFDLAGTVVACG
ncbi:alcohol dehydrogenase catalytic domain-containing protein, partial [uncultured Amnibacterium sp.]|uniref:alcohol dehydrogenase catalytic domain-containing protein n=1 Tax=uncultured Amnibacterium sp. TaxID=1631851 RepID=UPI0035CA7F92